jgi:hypothetical protein
VILGYKGKRARRGIMNRNRIRRTCLLLVTVALSPVDSSVGQQGNGSIPQAAPLPINSTFEITDPVVGMRTIHLHEEGGLLTVDETTRTYGHTSDSMKYEKVNYAGTEEDLRYDSTKTVVRIGASDGTFLIITLRNEIEAKAVADYVGRKCSLEFVGDAWRVRRSFQCPNGAGPAACQSFKELLDHDDLDIVHFYYSFATHEHRYVCFGEDSARFFLTRFSNYGHFGVFYQEAFEDGQSADENLGKISWVGDSGEINSNVLGNHAKPQVLGTVDASSLLYQTKFPNRMGTSTEYRLSIRWSTGRYTESRSGKDDKGKPFYHEESGICVEVN